MAQNSDIATPVQRWTRADFTALRAHLNRIPVERIRDLYYTEDDLYDLDIQSVGDLRRRIEDLRDTLIQRASVANPHMAELLRNARRTSLWSNKLVDHLVRAAETDSSSPRKSDTVSVWFKPRVAAALHRDGILTLADLLARIESRGARWWAPIPRVGAGKAAAILRWLQGHVAYLGTIALPSSDLVSVDSFEAVPGVARFAPLERLSIDHSLSGADGINRNRTFPLLAARNDKAAIEAYLMLFSDSPKTFRAYARELERFLLWCVISRGKAMSSTLVEDCEAYKAFLANPEPDWCAETKKPRTSADWRPFMAGGISAKSQRYAVQVIRSAFGWLLEMRYLAGNPWAGVKDPVAPKALAPLQIEKALSSELWEHLTAILDEVCAESDEVLRERFRMRGAAARMSLGAQFRLARAALLLMGDAGLRREEVANTLRCNLKPSPDSPELWELDVLGKGSKWRVTFPSLRAVQAIESHWKDRGDDFSFGMATTPLLSPVVLPTTTRSSVKHAGNAAGFSAEGIYQLVKTALFRVSADSFNDLSEDDRQILRSKGCHAFRHTFGVLGVEDQVPLDVLQQAFGHASMQTTTIYVQAPKKRAATELGKFFSKRQQGISKIQSSTE